MELCEHVKEANPYLRILTIKNQSKLSFIGTRTLSRFIWPRKIRHQKTEKKGSDRENARSVKAETLFSKHSNLSLSTQRAGYVRENLCTFGTSYGSTAIATSASYVLY